MLFATFDEFTLIFAFENLNIILIVVRVVVLVAVFVPVPLLVEALLPVGHAGQLVRRLEPWIRATDCGAGAASGVQVVWGHLVVIFENVHFLILAVPHCYPRHLPVQIVGFEADIREIDEGLGWIDSLPLLLGKNDHP